MIRIMSFNIRCATANDGDHRWECRKELVLERIRAFDPDLLGLQECRDDTQAAYVKSQLPDYAFIGVQRGGASATSIEMTPVLYKQAAFGEIERGHFWLSETPNVVGSKSWGRFFRVR